MRKIKRTYYLFYFSISVLLLTLALLINLSSLERKVNRVQNRMHEIEADSTNLTNYVHSTVEECNNRTKQIDVMTTTDVENIKELYTVADVNTPYKVFDVDNPSKHTKKIYTEYTAVTKKSSLQYELLNMDIDGDGVVDRLYDKVSGVRVVIDQYGTTRFCVAVGTYWADGEIGRFIDFVMDNGNVIPCITCDVKQDIHTMGEKGKYGYIANDLIEFYTDPTARGYVDSYIDENGNVVKLRYYAGDVSTTREDFAGAVRKVVVYDDYYEGFEKQ